MKFEARINGHPIENYIAEGGVSISIDRRNEKSVTTANGVLHRKSNDKRIVSIEFRDMDDRYYTLLRSYIGEGTCAFYFTDFINTPIDSVFYVSIGQPKFNKVIAGSITHVTGFSIELTEKY